MAARSNESEVSEYPTIFPSRRASAVVSDEAILAAPLLTIAWIRACVRKSSMPGSEVLFSSTGTWRVRIPEGRLGWSE